MLFIQATFNKRTDASTCDKLLCFVLSSVQPMCKETHCIWEYRQAIKNLSLKVDLHTERHFLESSPTRTFAF